MGKDGADLRELFLLVVVDGDISGPLFHFLQLSVTCLASLNQLMGVLFALALRNDAFDLVKPAIRTWSSMLNYIAANLPRSAALASFRCSALHALRRPHAISFQPGGIRSSLLLLLLLRLRRLLSSNR